MSHTPGVPKVMDDYGVWSPIKKCGLCKQAKMFLIRYGEGSKDYFMACQRCDRTEGKA